MTVAHIVAPCIDGLSGTSPPFRHPCTQHRSFPQNTCDPRWNEPLSFQIPTGSLVDAQIHLKVMGKQKVRDDLILGRMELPLAGVPSAGERGQSGAGSWFELLDGQGRLKIDAELVTRRPSLIV